MPTLTELLEAGAHFGHKKERSFPKAKKFTYTIRDSVYVIDLEKTVEELKKAIEYLQKATGSGQTVLFVGTKRQAKEMVKKTAENLKQPYVVTRWLGGTLTNFETIAKNLKALEKLEELTKSEDFQKYTKKERKRIEEKKTKMLAIFSGVRKMSKLPDVLFVVDTAKEDVAVKEARKMEIPIVGICDTNSNPDLIDFPIPANDDSEKTIALIMNKIEEGFRPKADQPLAEKGNKPEIKEESPKDEKANKKTKVKKEKK